MLVSILLLTVAWAQDDARITAKPDAVEPGESATLTWTTTGQSAFLSGVGKVAVKGSASVSPRTSTEYTLVSEGPAGIKYASVKVRVIGERGDIVFPDPSDFPKGVEGDRKSLGYPEFLDLVQATLQDKLKFRVRSEHGPRDNFYFFFTERAPRPDLLRSSDRGIRSRRITYAVRVDEPRAKSRNTHFEVKALVEYQRLGESMWRPETNQQIVNDAMGELKSSLETLGPGH